jgi:O-antigen ligase
VLLAGLILFFVALTAFLRATEPSWFDILIACAVLAAAANALLSILSWDHLAQPGTARLVGLGTLREPNSAGAVYGFYALLGVIWAGRMDARPARAALYAGALALLAFLLLTQARAALIACLFGLALLSALNRTDRPVVHLLIMLAAIAVAVAMAPDLDPNSLLRSHTWAIRLELWSDSLRHVAEAPLFGNGYLSGLSTYSEISDEHFTNWHNSYLAALRDGGMVGLALLLWLLAAALRRAWRAARASGDYALLALLCFGLIYMLISTDTLITRPRELWVVLWFPVGLLAGQRLAATGQ